MNNPVDFVVDIRGCGYECGGGGELLLSKMRRAEAEVTSPSPEEVVGRDGLLMV